MKRREKIGTIHIVQKDDKVTLFFIWFPAVCTATSLLSKLHQISEGLLFLLLSLSFFFFSVFYFPTADPYLLLLMQPRRHIILELLPFSFRLLNFCLSLSLSPSPFISFFTDYLLTLPTSHYCKLLYRLYIQRQAHTKCCGFVCTRMLLL